MDLHSIQLAIREDDIHEPKTALICIENTHNACGGKILPLSFMEKLHSFSETHRIPIHLDGARLWNAFSANDMKPYQISKYVSSISVCLSKGLGAPVGSVLIGDSLFIEKARRIRKALGGGMRQVGVLGAAGLIALNDFASVEYNVIYFLLIFVFTYVYTALLVNPQNYSEYLKRQNAFIPGVKPGAPTAEYIDNITSRITLPGALFLGLIAILPAFAAAFGVNRSFSIFFGGTSLLILVAVVLDTLSQIESYLLMRRYDGLVKSGKVQGRQTGSRLQSLGNEI
jgi:preprotein translocase subunit SecY